jgi:hypothetical protein
MCIIYQLGRGLTPADEHCRQPVRRIAEPFDGAREQRLNGEGGQGCLLRRLPDDRVAANERERRVPRPDGDRKIECRNHSDRAERVPLLHHAMRRTFAGDGQTIELTGQADREFANVDHLLHFAAAFRGDLASLYHDQSTELILGGAQLCAEEPYELATMGGRH